MTASMPVEGANFHLEPRQKAEILGAILLALFLFALDQTVVGTALPRIVTDLHGENLYTWSVTVYLLTATISGAGRWGEAAPRPRVATFMSRG